MWRATDTHPGHQVAVLPEAFGQEPARFLLRALQVARTVQALLNTLNLSCPRFLVFRSGRSKIRSSFPLACTLVR